MNEEYSNLIWTMKRSLAKEIMSMSDDKLVEEVNRSFVSVKYHIIVFFLEMLKFLILKNS